MFRLAKVLLARYGVTYVDDTDAHTGDWLGVLAINDNAVAAELQLTGATLTDVTLTQDVPYTLPITSITLTSGEIILWEAGE